MATYHGAPSGARDYVEADRSRADDYYLAEGTGIAQRFTADGDGLVRELASLDGDGYEAWVAGLDPDTGEPRGRLRTDGRAVRFVEVTVNGPKSWSLAAELHPDIATAYEAAQDRAAQQVIGWLAQHATARVGPRGGQVQVPVDRLEAVTVRHYTSRAGDPHRHLHLQINARVFAAGAWRGLHTVGVRDSLNAINGIGHAAMMTDPAFRQALAAHGYVMTRSGEIEQLAPFVGAFSKRAAQIQRNTDRYERAWTAAHPGEQPGPGLRQAWDARAWAEGRPDKVTPAPGADLRGRWLAELAQLGYVDSDRPVDLTVAPVGHLDRDQIVQLVLGRLGAGRSAWNAADVRGEIEQHLAAAGIVTDPAVRGELAEDLTARTLDRCVPLLDEPDVPEHVRALTSVRVLGVEAELVSRLEARAADPDQFAPTRDVHDGVPVAAYTAERFRLDRGQAAVVAALAGDQPLVVVEGAAGAGKTTALAATRSRLMMHDHSLVVVTPTLKAAQAARAQVGAAASSAAAFAYVHGFRWDTDGTWTRLEDGQVDPVTGRTHHRPDPDMLTGLGAGDLLLVDEAGMLDQDTALALLTIADDVGARVAFLGDRHQLPAVGRGGVLEHAARSAGPNGQATLDVVHRFTRTATDTHGREQTVPDREYAQLSVQMRTGTDPETVFDTLHQRGLVRIHPTDGERLDHIAIEAVTARLNTVPVLVVADTRDQVAQLNAVIREHLVATGHVDDHTVVITRAGERIGAGDRVTTRRNNPHLQVANRDTWTVTAVDPTTGQLTIRPDTDHGDRGDHGGRAGQGGDGSRVLDAGYVARHVELGYASTAHGAQGATTAAAHVVLGEQTGAAAAYVAMTRGRDANTAHLVADSIDDARARWVAVFGRDRADLGPAAARDTARADLARYGHQQPTQPGGPSGDARSRPVRVDHLVAALRQSWDAEAKDLDWLDRAETVRDQLRTVAQLRHDQAADTAPLQALHTQATATARAADAAVAATTETMTAETAQLTRYLQAAWDAEQPAARQHANTVLAGPGRFGIHTLAVNRSAEELARWAVRWQPILPAVPTQHREIARYAAGRTYAPTAHEQIQQYATADVAARHPEHQQLTAAAHTAHQTADQAARQLRETQTRYAVALARHSSHAYTPDPDALLAELEPRITARQEALQTTRDTISRFETALRAAPDTASEIVPDPRTPADTANDRPPAAGGDRVATERDRWHSDRDAAARAERHAAISRANIRAAARDRHHAPTPRPDLSSPPIPISPPSRGPSISR